MDRLPQGLDPVTAGRFGLWLLGKRASVAASKRVAFPPRRDSVGSVATAVRAWLPWAIVEYPGRARWLAALCGVQTETARSWLYRGRRMPTKHADKLATYLENVAAILQLRALEIRSEYPTGNSAPLASQVKATEKNRGDARSRDGLRPRTSKKIGRDATGQVNRQNSGK